MNLVSSHDSDILKQLGILKVMDNLDNFCSEELFKDMNLEEQISQIENLRQGLQYKISHQLVSMQSGLSLDIDVPPVYSQKIAKDFIIIHPCSPWLCTTFHSFAIHPCSSFSIHQGCIATPYLLQYTPG